jgi:hypothetical protein
VPRVALGARDVELRREAAIMEASADDS